MVAYGFGQRSSYSKRTSESRTSYFVKMDHSRRQIFCAFCDNDLQGPQLVFYQAIIAASCLSGIVMIQSNNSYFGKRLRSRHNYLRLDAREEHPVECPFLDPVQEQFTLPSTWKWKCHMPFPPHYRISCLLRKAQSQTYPGLECPMAHIDGEHKYDLMVEWEIGETTSEPLDTMAANDSVHYTAMPFHPVRDATTTGTLIFCCIRSNDNPADILSRRLGYQQGRQILQPILYWRGDTARTFDEEVRTSHRNSQQENGEKVNHCLLNPTNLYHHHSCVWGVTTIAQV